MLLAVNGTLMRGLELNQNLLETGATFVCSARTAPVYRLWSVNDLYPGMLRVKQGGATIAVEIWEIEGPRLFEIIENEPPGLTVGWVNIDDGSKVLGVLAEPYIIEEMKDITEIGDWRAYINSLKKDG